jgi:heat shock protein HslJ
VKIKRQGEATYSKAKKSYILEFTSDTTYSFIFDVNDCFGLYEIINSGNIKINAMGCTEVCCDSDFAIELMQLFPKMNNYYGRGNELIFEGEGKIILKPN